MDNPFKPVKSSLISSYQYDKDTKTLTVTFVGRSDEFVYKNVTPDLVSAVFDKAQSVGKAFYNYIVRSKAVKYQKAS